MYLWISEWMNRTGTTGARRHEEGGIEIARREQGMMEMTEIGGMKTEIYSSSPDLRHPPYLPFRDDANRTTHQRQRMSLL